MRSRSCCIEVHAGHLDGLASRFFRQRVRDQIWACAILPEDTHLVIARHTYTCEQLANLLKGAATSRLYADDRHPLAEHAEEEKRPPTMWLGINGSCIWIAMNTSRTRFATVANPIKEGKKPQEWKFVTPYAGSDTGWTTYG